MLPRLAQGVFSTLWKVTEGGPCAGVCYVDIVCLANSAFYCHCGCHLVLCSLGIPVESLSLWRAASFADRGSEPSGPPEMRFSQGPRGCGFSVD